MTARVLVGGSEVRPEKSLKSGHDRSAFVVVKAPSTLVYRCPVCLTESEDGYCACCGRMLVTRDLLDAA